VVCVVSLIRTQVDQEGHAGLQGEAWRVLRPGCVAFGHRYRGIVTQKGRGTTPRAWARMRYPSRRVWAYGPLQLAAGQPDPASTCMLINKGSTTGLLVQMPTACIFQYVCVLQRTYYVYCNTFQCEGWSGFWMPIIRPED
jgi:hypothetical protein